MGTVATWAVPRPIEGDAEAVERATLYADSGSPVKLSYAWITITPEWAREFRSKAMSQLPVPPLDVDHMASDMLALKWMPTGEPIIISDDGRLMDGRKRLDACIAANTPFVSLVLFNVSATLFDTVNNLRARRLSDHLEVQHELHARSLAYALKLLWRMRDGGFDYGRLGSDRQLLGLLDAHPGIRHSLGESHRLGRSVRLPLFAAMHYKITQVDPEGGREFFRLMNADELAVRNSRNEKRLPMGHPIRALNDWIKHSRTTGESFDRERDVGAAALILCYNAFKAKETVKTLAWEPYDAAGNPQPFPMLRGWTPEHALVKGDIAVLRRDETPSDDEEAPRPEAFVPELAGSAMTVDFEQHPEAVAVWNATFPDGLIPEVSLRMIGPNEANDFLTLNTQNRGQIKPTIERYARDMAAGNFRSLNGQTVKIGRNGRLLDSQHRCEAILGSKVSLPFVVVKGLHDDVFAAMDRADTKTFAKVLRDRSASNAGTVAGAVRLQMFWEKNRFAKISGISPSIPELDEVYQRNRGLDDSLEFNNRLRGTILPSAANFLEYQFKKACPDRADEFFNKLASGANLDVGDPILVLRNKLVAMNTERQREGRVGARTRAGAGANNAAAKEPDPIMQIAMTIMAWNAWLTGKTVVAQGLSWRRVVEKGFPEISTGEPVVKVSKPRGRPKRAVAAPDETAPAPENLG